jgi:4-diphosphocytidyl-2C-methyl-D-erythritol kinase
MAMDKNDLRSLLNKVPKIGKTQELHPTQRLAFLYLQLQERKKVLYRAQVQVETATVLAEQDDTAANNVAEQQIKEATAQMKAIRWEIDGLNKLIKAHIEVHEDLEDIQKAQFGIDA